jgi:hypothetical protein
MTETIVCVSGYFNPIHHRPYRTSTKSQRYHTRKSICKELIDGLGDKIQSSTWLIEKNKLKEESKNS